MLVSLVALAALPAFAWNSTLVRVDENGRLSYTADANGNRIPDFSHAGYKGGGVPLPTIPVVRTLSPATGDQTARIQAALDEVAALPVQADGYRGALQLAAGTWEVLGTLRIRANGVVLAGVGDGDDPATNTILRRTGTSTSAIIQAGNTDDSFRREIANTRSQITTARVPVGARSFDVDHPEYYRVGDAVIVWHPSTQAWLDAVDRGGVTDENFWKPGQIDLRYHRYITAISGNTITVDAPVFCHLDRALSQSYLYKYDSAHVLRNMGIEKLQVDIVTAGPTSETHSEDAITFVGAEDSWIRDTTAKHFWHAGVQWEGSTRCTAERCRAIDPHSVVTGGRRYNFSMYHSQLILVRDSYANQGRHAYVCNGTSLDAGVVFLDCISAESRTASEGHRHWGTGLLYDNIVAVNRIATDFLGLYNRGTFGTGHGWASAHSVAWNVNAAGGRIYLQKPPTAQNYAIGSFGNVTGNGPFAGSAGHIEGTNTPGLEPRSLYLAQLAQRLAESSAPQITTQPVAQNAAVGESVVLRVAASGALSYQWRRNGANIAGATSSSLLLRGVTAAEAGDYSVIVTNAIGSVTSSTARLEVASTADPGRLTNLAIRSTAGTGAQTLIVGCVLGGGGTTGSRPFLLRAAGPSLTPFGVPDVLVDPSLELLANEALIATNNDWNNDAQIAELVNRLQAFPFTTPRDAALHRPALTSGRYDMKISGAAGTTGVALAEIYDAASAPAPSAPRLINVSARTQTGAGGDVLIAGFVVGGSTSKTVLIRAIGPSLAEYGVTGTLADPRLELYQGDTRLFANDDWNGAEALRSAVGATGAFSVADTSRDAALLATLAPGNYTAQVRGAPGTTGVVLVEVYEVP